MLAVILAQVADSSVPYMALRLYLWGKQVDQQHGESLQTASRDAVKDTFWRVAWLQSSWSAVQSEPFLYTAEGAVRILVYSASPYSAFGIGIRRIWIVQT
jgi:hypothetical protein